MNDIKHKYLSNGMVELTIANNDQLSKIQTKVRKFKDKPIVLVIQTDLATFHADLGKSVSKDTDFQNDRNAYELVGKCALDYYIPDTYFVKSIAENKVYEIRGVKDDVKGS